MQTDDGREIECGQRWRRPDGEHVEVIGIEPPTVHINVLHQGGVGVIAADAKSAKDFHTYTRLHRFQVTVRGAPKHAITRKLGRALASYRSAVPRDDALAPEYEADVWASDEAAVRSLIEGAIAGTEAEVIAIGRPFQ